MRRLTGELVRRVFGRRLRHCTCLTDVLRRIAAIAPGDTVALEALLPDRWLAAHPEHRLEQREEESREAQARRRLKRAARRVAAAQ
jgi:hypothetical protein